MIKQSFKTKVALMISYIGTNYHVSLLNSDDINKIRITRGARTDKGVHALCNIISLKLQINPYYCPNMIGNTNIDKNNINWNLVKEQINKQLPQDIRLNGIKYVTQTFNVKNQAESRIYSYIIPEFIESNDQLQELCNQYLGTHNFHNYTQKQQYSNPSSNRYIKEFYFNTIKYKQQNFHKFTIHANSFMYHQIRKMIGTIYQIKKENKSIDYIKESFTNNKQNLYIAPQNGLYLKEILFTGYNLKDDIPQKIEILEEERKEINQFEEQLIQYICEQYIQNNILEEWYNKIQFYQQQ